MSTPSVVARQQPAAISTAPNEGSLRLVLTLAFGHKWLLLLVPLICATAVASLGMILPPIYEGGFTVLIKAPEVDPSLISDNTDIVYKAGRLEESLRTDEFHILNSSIPLNRAVSTYLDDHPAPKQYWTNALVPWSAGGTAEQSPEDREQAQRDLSALLASTLEVTPVKDSDIIEVRLHHHDRGFLEAIVKLFAEHYLRYRRSVWVASDSPDFYREQATAALVEWELQLESQRSLLARMRAIDSGLNQTALAERLGQTQADLDRIAQSLTHLHALRETLHGLTSEQALDFASRLSRDSAVLEPLKAAIGRAEADYQTASAVHAPTSRVMSTHRERVEALEAEYKAAQLRLLDSSIEQSEIERDLVAEKLQNDEERLRRLETLQLQWTVGQKQAELLGAKFESSRLKYQEVESHHLLRDTIENAVSLVSPPGVAAGPLWPKQGLMTATTMLLALVLTTLFLILRHFSQGRYWLPEEINRDLGLPVLASLPYRPIR